MGSAEGSERVALAGSVRVLVVEDNPHIIEMYSYVLRKLGTSIPEGSAPLEVHFAADGNAALAMLREARFALVITDLLMPVMDGYQLVEKLRGEPVLADIPVLAISGGGNEAKDRALAAGVNVFLRKPVRFGEVLDTVKALLRL